MMLEVGLWDFWGHSKTPDLIGDDSDSDASELAAELLHDYMQGASLAALLLMGRQYSMAGRMS